MKQAVRTMIAAGFLVTGLVACKSKIQETAQQPAPQPQTAAPAPVDARPGDAPAPASQAPAKYFTGKVLETMNAGGYTYVHVDNGTEKIWAAAPQFEAKVGEKVTVPEGMPMKDYESKTLNRKFDVVFFVGAIGKGDQPPAQMAAPAPAGAARPPSRRSCLKARIRNLIPRRPPRTPRSLSPASRRPTRPSAMSMPGRPVWAARRSRFAARWSSSALRSWARTGSTSRTGRARPAATT